MKPAVLLNARAGRARRDPDLLERLRARLPRDRVQATAAAEQIGPALDALRAAGSDVLLVVGGDGSVGGTLTPLLERWPRAEWPAIVLAPGGTVNTIARSLGAREAPEALLDRLLSGAAPRLETRRPLVYGRPREGPAHAGMIFANGVGVRWLRMYYEDSPGGVRGAAWVVARILASALVGGPLARRLFAPSGLRAEVDGMPLDLERFTVLAAASVRHIGLGFRPFHTAGSDPTRFHFAWTGAGAGRLGRELPSLRSGRVRPSSCVHHRSARRVALRFDEPQPWSLDADLFPATRELELTATQPLRFWVP